MALAHEPLGRPGGPGLFHRKGEQLPAFIQHIANDLMSQRGMPESEAIATAIAQCKRWAAGGPDVKPETRAKAAAAVAEWERLKAGTHAKRSAPVSETTWIDRAAFNEAAHPRAPAGAAGGGQFAASSGTAGAKDTRPTPGNKNPVGQGEHGKRVSDLQARLNALGFKPPLKVDGIFGPKTLAAVKAFQRSHGLKVDGLVGPHTTAALRTKPAAAHKAPAKPAAHPPVKAHAKPAPVKPAPVKPAPAKPAMVKAARSAAMSTDSGYDADGLDGSWDGDLDGLPDLTGLMVADFEAITGPDDPGASRMAKLGSGGRFKALKAKLAAKGASDPGALAAYIGRKRYGKAKFTALASKARKGKGGGMHRAELFRSYALEDYHIVRTGEGDSSGRVVEAYMTVFGEATEIRDHQGHYKEDIDRAAFNKRIADLERSRNGFGSAKVFYNHGMTIHGSPSDRYSMPVAVCEGIRAETRGPITRSRYLDTPLGNEVLEMWRSGAITAQSFTGAIIRSSPELRPGERHRPRNGQLPVVRRLELGLKEYGPTPFPAYQGAELVGVRMSPLGTWTAADDDELEELDDLKRQDDMEQLDDDVALPPDGEAAAGGPPEVHPTREHAHRLYAMRTEELFREAGIAPLKGQWQ